jgi:hypothetical protein
VVKKRDIRSIQQKILQNSDFAKERDMNPFPHGETASYLAKMFAQIFFAKIGFCKKHDFRCKFCSNIFAMSVAAYP